MPERSQRHLPSKSPLAAWAIAHLEQLVGADPLDDPRVRAELKAPWDRERKRKALEGRLDRIGLGLLDRYCHVNEPRASWTTTQRIAELMGVHVKEGQIETGVRKLEAIERALGLEPVRYKRPGHDSGLHRALRATEPFDAALQEAIDRSAGEGRDRVAGFEWLAAGLLREQARHTTDLATRRELYGLAGRLKRGLRVDRVDEQRARLVVRQLTPADLRRLEQAKRRRRASPEAGR
jgi:hypothetical protein